MSNVFICHTIYHVYISLLKQFNSDINSDIILVDTIPEVQQLANCLRSESLFNTVNIIYKKDIFLNTRSYHLNHAYIAWKKKKLSSQLYYLFQYDNIYIFNDYTELGAYLNLSGIPYHLLEDGCDCYKKTNQHKPSGRARLAKQVLWQLFKIPAGLGESDNIIDVEVNDAHNMHTQFDCMVLEVPRKMLMSHLSCDQIGALFRIFNASGLFEIAKGSTIILTEPLWEKGITRHGNDTVAFYKRIAESATGESCYIKPHPRDDSDYCSVFAPSSIIDRNLPIELLNYLGKDRFSAGITYSSTSISLLEACSTRWVMDPASVSENVQLLQVNPVSCRAGRLQMFHEKAAAPKGVR